MSLTMPAIWMAALAVVSLFGMLQRPPLAPVNLTYLLFAGVALVFLFRLFAGGLRRFSFTWGDLAVLLLFIGQLFASFVAYFVYEWPLQLTQASSITFLGMLLLYFMARAAIVERQDVKTILHVLLFGLTCQLLLSLVQYAVEGGSGMETLGGADLQFVDATSFQEGLRLNGPAGNPNMFVSIPLLVFPVVLSLMAEDGNRKRKLWWTVLGALCAIGIVVTFSRSAWAAWAVSALFVGKWFFSHLGRSRVAVVSLLLVVTILAGAALSRLLNITCNLVETRVASVAEQESYGDRSEIWMHGLQIIGEYPLGIGLGNYREVSEKIWSPYEDVRGRSPHASLLALWTEGGPLSGIAFLSLMFLQVFGHAGRPVLRRRPQQTPRMAKSPGHHPETDGPASILAKDGLLTFGLRAGFLALWVHAGFHSIHNQIVVWLLSASLVSLSELPAPHALRRNESTE